MPGSGKEIKGLADKILEHYGDYEDIRILQYDNLLHHLKQNGIQDAVLTNSQGEVEFTMSNPGNSLDRSVILSNGSDQINIVTGVKRSFLDVRKYVIY